MEVAEIQGLAVLIVIFSIPLISGALCAHFAGKKNRSKGLWFMLGAFAPLLAAVFLFFLPAKTTTSRGFAAPEPQYNSPKCPACHKNVPADANQCPYCLTVLQDSSQIHRQTTASSSGFTLSSEKELNEQQSSRPKWRK